MDAKYKGFTVITNIILVHMQIRKAAFPTMTFRKLCADIML